ncbi:MAG: hypothetical protein LRY27_02590 [Chitinophagales bacterium]|nr:hypothetical protein [Chitinophagales bacterium]
MKTLLFSAGLWLSALTTQGNELHSAFTTYQSGNSDYVHGPILSADERISYQECQLWNRHFKMNKTIIDAFIQNTFPIQIEDVPLTLKEWPAKGNAYLQNLGYTLEDNYAPFEDVNSNGIYDPQNGDYPLIKGDQAVYWIINDYEMPYHYDYSSEKIGAEIQIMAYAYADMELQNAVFYDYKLSNISNKSYKDLYFSQFIDPDLEHYISNALGVDTVHKFVYTYQRDANYPKAFLTGFICTPNNNLLTSYYSFGLGGCFGGNPTNAEQKRSFQIIGDACGVPGRNPFEYYSIPAIQMVILKLRLV